MGKTAAEITALGLFELHQDFIIDVIANIPNYTDTDLTFECFIDWVCRCKQ